MPVAIIRSGARHSTGVAHDQDNAHHVPGDVSGTVGPTRPEIVLGGYQRSSANGRIRQR